MRFLSAAIFSLVASLVSAGPLSLKSIERVEGEKLPNSYIVALKDGTDKASVITSVKNLLGPGDAVTHDDWDSRVYNGFAVQILGLDILNLVLALPGIASISEDSIVTAYTVQNVSHFYYQVCSYAERGKLSSTTRARHGVSRESVSEKSCLLPTPALLSMTTTTKALGMVLMSMSLVSVYVGFLALLVP